MANVAHPGGKATVHLLRIKEEEDTAIGVMRREAIGQFQEGVEPGVMGVAKAFDSEPGIGTSEDSTDGTDENVDEEMGFVPIVEAEVGTIAITIHQVLECRLCFERGGWARNTFGRCIPRGRGSRYR